MCPKPLGPHPTHAARVRSPVIGHFLNNTVPFSEKLTVLVMAPPVIREYLGKNVDYFAAVGALATAYCVFKLLRSLWNGLSVFVLARALGLGVNLRRMGSWAGRRRVKSACVLTMYGVIQLQVIH